MKRALTICILLLAACSSDEKATVERPAAKPAPPPPPSAQQARELIAGSAELGEHEFTNAGFTTPVSGATSEPVRQSVRELAAAGWLAVDGAGEVTLSAKSRGDKRFLLRANGLLDIVPLAKKEMGEVGGVQPQPDGTVRVDFTWRWLPNEVGAAFRTGPVHDRFAAEQNGKATLMWDGTNWMVLKIE